MKLPIFEQLEKAEKVLIAGAGGGFDVFTGVPLMTWLREQGKQVHLANLTFSNLYYSDGVCPVPTMMRIEAGTSGSAHYFPEGLLARWLADNGDPVPVHAIWRSGYKDVRLAYDWLVANLQVDTVVLVDGGTDILMRGDEAGLGTPEEDIVSLAAAFDVEGPARKMILCLGFGIDTYHGVCHAHFLENVAALSVDGGYLGSWSLLYEMPEMQAFASALEYAHERTPARQSIVNSSILAAARGHFGDHHPTARTEGSELFINPLMTQYWAFDLNAVARRNLYLDRLRQTSNYSDVRHEIATFRDQHSKHRPWTSLPQ